LKLAGGPGPPENLKTAIMFAERGMKRDVCIGGDVL